MARQIIILQITTSVNIQLVSYCFWIPVISMAAQSGYYNPSAVSLYRQVTRNELALIQSGQVVEFSDTIQMPLIWTLSQVQGELLRNYAIQFAQLNASTGRYTNFGMFYDGTVWRT